MYPFTLKAIAYLLVINQLGSVWAFLTIEHPKPVEVPNVNELEKRASPFKVALDPIGFQAWHGSKRVSPFFRQILTDKEMWEATEETYQTLRDSRQKLPGTLYVCIISIPGVAVVGGTVFRGGLDWFEERAEKNAPFFWATLPGRDQGVRQGYDSNKWHAEAVAAVRAEEEFGKDHMVNGRWPAGTRIYVHGRDGLNCDALLKPACRPPSSPAKIPCKGWLEALGFDLVPPRPQPTSSA